MYSASASSHELNRAESSHISASVRGLFFLPIDYGTGYIRFFNLVPVRNLWYTDYLRNVWYGDYVCQTHVLARGSALEHKGSCIERESDNVKRKKGAGVYRGEYLEINTALE